MITRVMGKVTATHWYVEPNYHEERKEDGTVEFVFDKRPELKSDVRELEPMEICRYEDKPNMDIPCGFYFPTRIHIGDECVDVLESNFYADRDEYRQFVNKVIKNTDINQEESREKYNLLIRDYNKQSIEGDEKLLAYCRLHHLDPEETDVDELKKILKENDTIESNVINISEDLKNFYSSSSLFFNTTADSLSNCCDRVSNSINITV